MGALILLALGLGVALAAYELAPGVHSRVDAYARAIRAANAAHSEADVHLTNAHVSADAADYHAARATQEPMRPVRPMRPTPPVRPPAPPPPSLAPTPTAPPAPPTAPSAPTAPVSPLPPIAPIQPPSDAHADAAQTAADAAVDHAAAATDANRTAAQATADAAKAAQTQAEKQAAAQSAQKVLDREKQIDDMIAKLGLGKCGVHIVSGITAQRRDQLITRLRGAGMTVTGDNPWNIDTNMSGVTLRAVWDPRSSKLRLIVTDWGFLAQAAGCDVVWSKIDTRLKEVLTP